MAELPQYLVVLGIPTETLRPLNAVRRRLYPVGFKRAPAHLTLMPPFRLQPEVGEELLIERLTKFTEQLSYRFTVTILGIDTAFPARAHLVLGIKHHSHLRETVKELPRFLKRCIAEATAEEVVRRKQTFLPHITLFKTHDVKRRRELISVLNAQFAGRQFKAQGLELWRFEDGRWQTRKRFTITKKNEGKD